MSGEDVGGAFWTPAAIRAYLSETNADVDATAKDVTAWWFASGSLDDKAEIERRGVLVKRWAVFRDNWRQFYADRLGAWLSFYSDVERAHDARALLREWRAEFRRNGLKFSSPDPTTIDPVSRSQGLAGKIVVGVLIGAATYVTVEALKTARSK